MAGERGISGYTDRVRDAIYDHVFESPGTEVGGVLVGSRLGEGHSIVNGSIRADTAQGDLTTLTFTHEAWSDIHASIERDYPEREIVGWYHSHPGHGIFLSGHDKFIHENFFGDPACLALVVDPLNGREGLFGWEGDKIVDFWERETSRAGIAPSAPRRQPEIDEPVGDEARIRPASQSSYRAAFAIPSFFGFALGVFAAIGLHALAGA